MRFVIFVVCNALSMAAMASTIVGNPNSGVTVVHGAGIEVDSVRAYRCDGGFETHWIGQTLNQGDQAAVVFTEGDYCDVVVRLRWGPLDELEPVAVGGFERLSVASGAASFEVVLHEGLGRAWIP